MMPQFNLAFYGGQIFWLLVCFCVLYICVRYIFLPRVAKQIAEREQYIQQMTDKAAAINDMREKRAQDYAIYEQQTVEQSARMMQQAHEDIAAEHSAQEDHLLHVLKAHTDKVEKEVNAQQRQIFDNIKLIAGQFLGVIFGALYHVCPNKAKLNYVLDKQIKEQNK